ncbi:hypothetical protein D3C86_1361810 [compost metagenome]
MLRQHLCPFQRGGRTGGGGRRRGERPRGGLGPGGGQGVWQQGGRGIQHAGVEREYVPRLHGFRGERGERRVQPSELFEIAAQHVPQGAYLIFRQAGLGHQLGGHRKGGDGAGLPRVEVGADAAALIVGILLEQLVDLLPLDGNEAGLAATGQIAYPLVGVAGDQEGGIQGAVAESLQPVACRGDGRHGELTLLPAHGVEQCPAGDPVP